MQKYISIIVLIILIGCGNEPQYREVIVNKTLKVYSEDYHDHAEDYTFKWQAPIGPNNKIVECSVKNDMLIFTPETVGKYEIMLSIEDISEDVVAKEIFYFKAIPETTKVTNVQPAIVTKPNKSSIIKKNPTTKSEKKLQSNQDNVKKSKKTLEGIKQPIKQNITHGEYAIQISAWPSLDEARQHQLELIDKGFDAYTKKYYWQKRDEVWYRVRVGNFSNINKALAIQKQIESFTGITTWLDIVPSK